MKKIVMIQRAACFSPGSVEKDWAILHAVGEQLRQRGEEVCYVPETLLTDDMTAEVFLSMGRLTHTLEYLQRQHDSLVINTTESIQRTSRIFLDTLMREKGIPVAPRDGDCGYWIKRSEVGPHKMDDVVYAEDAQTCADYVRRMQQQGSKVLVTAHVKGAHVKFYRVRGTDFFFWLFPEPGPHIPFDAEALRRDADIVAEAIGIQVYGGDCIVREDGSYVIIDFNDWPSFASCREDAASAIASLV